MDRLDEKILALGIALLIFGALVVPVLFTATQTVLVSQQSSMAPYAVSFAVDSNVLHESATDTTVRFIVTASNLLLSPVSGVLVGVIPSYNPNNIGSVSTGADGSAAYSDVGAPIGVHKYRFIGSKIGYRNGYTEKTVVVEPGNLLSVNVSDSKAHPAANTKILVDGVYKSTTNTNGKTNIPLTAGNYSVSALCANNDVCDMRTISLNQNQILNLKCDCKTNVLVGVSTPHSECNVPGLSYCPIANVYVAVDDQQKGLTNPVGYLDISDLELGTHKFDVYLYLKENPEDTAYALKTASKTVTITKESNTVDFIVLPTGNGSISVSNLAPTEQQNAVYLTDTNTKAQILPLIGVVIIGGVLVQNSWNYGTQCVGPYLKDRTWEEKCTLDTVFVGTSAIGFSPAAGKIGSAVASGGTKIVELIETIPGGSRFTGFFGNAWKFLTQTSDSVYLKISEIAGPRVFKVGEFLVEHGNSIKNPLLNRIVTGSGQELKTLMLQYIDEAALASTEAPSAIRGAIGEKWIQELTNETIAQTEGYVIRQTSTKALTSQFIEKEFIYNNQRTMLTFAKNGVNVNIKVVGGEKIGEMEGLLLKDNLVVTLEAKTGTATKIAEDLSEQLPRNIEVLNTLTQKTTTEALVAVPKGATEEIKALATQYPGLNTLINQGKVHFIEMTQTNDELLAIASTVKNAIDGG